MLYVNNLRKEIRWKFFNIKKFLQDEVCWQAKILFKTTITHDVKMRISTNTTEELKTCLGISIH